MACQLNSSISVRHFAVILVLALAACRGENPPRDYQNAPPAATHPAQTREESPAAKGMPPPTPEPSTGVEGTATGETSTVTTTIKDQAPVTTTHT